MISPQEATARVQSGAAHLDKVKPGWFNRIDDGTLALHDECSCIVGQLCKGAFDLQALGLKTYLEGEAHGFSAMDPFVPGSRQSVEFWAPLQDAWIAAIADRRLRSEVSSIRPLENSRITLGPETWEQVGAP